jgi:hypothetical protein
MLPDTEEEPSTPETPPEPEEKSPELQQEASPAPRNVTILFRETDDEEQDRALLDRLWGVLEAHPGPDNVRLLVDEGDGTKALRLSQGVRLGNGLEEKLRGLLGAECLRVS